MAKLLLYVNGLLQSSVDYTTSWQATGATVIGGGKFNGQRSHFASGLIDEVLFFTSPLTASAVAYVGTNGGGILNINTTVVGPTVSPYLFGAFMKISITEPRAASIIMRSETADLMIRAVRCVHGSRCRHRRGDALTSDNHHRSHQRPDYVREADDHVGRFRFRTRTGISNSGYFGVAVAPSTTYTATFMAKATAGFTGPLNVALESQRHSVRQRNSRLYHYPVGQILRHFYHWIHVSLDPWQSLWLCTCTRKGRAPCGLRPVLALYQ